MATLTYPLLIDLGFLAGLGVGLWQARQKGLGLLYTLDAALFSLTGGFLGSRLVQIIVHWEYYSSRPMAAFRIFDGGWAWQGGLLGSILGLLLYAQWKGGSFWKLADVLSPCLALGQGIGWLGCMEAGCGYGILARGPLAYELPDIYGISAYRLPVQAFTSGFFIFLFLVLILWPTSRSYPGFYFISYLLLSSLGLFFLEFARADETLYFGILRWSQVVEAGEFFFATALLYTGKQARSPGHAQT